MAAQQILIRQRWTFALLFSFILFSGCDAIINMMAFHPDSQSRISADRLPTGVEEIFLRTADHLNIQSYYLRNKSSDKLLIYFHGNAGNIGHRIYDLMKIRALGINVLGVSYRGYGRSEGKPSEKGIYIDGKAALGFSQKELGFPIERIFILGRSIGTTVAIHSAMNLNAAGLILVSPLTSGKEQTETTTLAAFSFLAGDAFNNISKINQISCPVLIIHGEHDKIIPFNMGQKIYDGLKVRKKLVKIDGAGHNDLSTKYYDAYWAAIDSYLNNDTGKEGDINE